MSIANELRRDVTEEKEEGLNIPVHVFPEDIQRVITTLTNDAGLPKEYITSAILFAISVVIGNRYEIDTKYNGVQPAILYIALFGTAGSGKSPVIKYILNPIYNHESIKYEAFTTELAAYQQAAKEARANNTDFEETEPVFTHQYLTTDTTPEAWTATLSKVKHGFGIVADELEGLLNVKNSYSGSIESQLLSYYNGDPISLNRKKEGHVRIDKPCTSIITGTQLSKVKDTLSNGRDKSGLIDRFICAICENHKKKYRSEQGVNKEVLHSWENIINRLLHTHEEHTEPTIISYTQEAAKLMYEWDCENINKQNAESSDTVISIYAKLVTNVHRLALCLQLLRYACQETSSNLSVEVQAAKGAIELIEYYRETALMLREYADHYYDPTQELEAYKKEFYAALPTQFTKAEAIDIANKQGVNKATLDRLLTKKSLFEKLQRGEYKKRYDG